MTGVEGSKIQLLRHCPRNKAKEFDLIRGVLSCWRHNDIMEWKSRGQLIITLDYITTLPWAGQCYEHVKMAEPRSWQPNYFLWSCLKLFLQLCFQDIKLSNVCNIQRCHLWGDHQSLQNNKIKNKLERFSKSHAWEYGLFLI